jgi:hypothetical protein
MNYFLHRLCIVRIFLLSLLLHAEDNDIVWVNGKMIVMYGDHEV